MNKANTHQGRCEICGKTFPARDLVPAGVIRDALARFIAAAQPAWSARSAICRADLNRFRSEFVHSLLESEKGDLSSLEQEVLESLQKQEVLSRNVEEEFDQTWTLGDRLADRIASFESVGPTGTDPGDPAGSAFGNRQEGMTPENGCLESYLAAAHKPGSARAVGGLAG